LPKSVVIDPWTTEYYGNVDVSARNVYGHAQTSSSLRGFYLTGARELDGLVDPRALQQALAAQLFSVEEAPTPMLIDMLRFRINPARADGKKITLGYRFTDTGEAFTLTLRNSVLEVHPTLPSGADAVLRLTRAFGNQIVLGTQSIQSGIDTGAIRVEGNRTAVTEFHAIFDRPEELPDPHLAVR
jgi:alkyl sulfatase BDS1-like metallo-beta-lactamase superfamily hydrolase